MKLKAWVTLLLMIFFIACNDDIITQQDSPSISTEEKESDGQLFLNFNLNGAFYINATRADTVDYENCENKIYQGRIYIFEESADEKEENSKCVSWGVLKDPKISDGSDIVSKSAHYPNVELLEFDYDKTKNYYALVVLNWNSDFKLPMIDDLFGNWAYQPQTSNMVITVKDLNLEGYNTDRPVYKFITMTNATGQIKRQSGAFTPTTLVKIDNADIQRGKFKDNHPCNTVIYVQRNVAKVVLNTPEGNSLPSENKMVKIGQWTIQMNIHTWFLDVINKETYPVQKIEGLSWNETRFHSGKEEYDQVYWAIDPNYDIPEKCKENGDFASSLYPVSQGAGAPLYCLENTFDIENMIQGQTTRAILRGAMEWWGNTDGQRNTFINLPEQYLKSKNGNYPNNRNAVKGVYNDFDEFGYYVIGKGNDLMIWDMMHIRGTIEPFLEELFGGPCEVKLKNELNADNKGGKYSLKNLIDISLPEDVSLDDVPWDSLANLLGLSDATYDLISYYQKGWTYYPIRIRHFEDEEGVDWEGVTSVRERDDTRVAKYEDRHLGRYGVVRNNEYEIIIKSITGLGSPYQFPDITNDDTDDMPEENMIEVSIRVRNWTKRQNAFEL